MRHKTPNTMIHYHTHHLSPNQCSSTLMQTIKAPLSLVWSIVRNFQEPQADKKFIKSCTMLVSGDGGGVGSIREVTVVSGLPAKTSVERLDTLDDELHVMRFSIIGGDHRLVNYQSTITLLEDNDNCKGGKTTVVMESYVVDIPAGNSEEETCLFINTIIETNLMSLANIVEDLANCGLHQGFV